MAKKTHVSNIRYTDLSPKEFDLDGGSDGHYTRLISACPEQEDGRHVGKRRKRLCK